MNLIIPEHYDTKLTLRKPQEAIKYIGDTFPKEFGQQMNLERISAPLYVRKSSGLNDDLSGVERKVSFDAKELPGDELEIVQSLAKWKRWALGHYGFQPGEGLYTNMNAIRRDEDLDNLHSIYVDQWDWERVITKEQRTIAFLKSVVKRIYAAILRTEYLTCEAYPQIKPFLPSEITFIHSEDLLQMFPDKTPKEREDAICKKYGAVFLIGIGAKLSNGEKHDGRAPDYDDWSTISELGKPGLNGDILIWYPPLQRSFELSSMGIRVDEKALLKQLEIEHAEERKELYFHKKLLNNELPLSIGGGIGQSRLCMVLLHKGHIGEIQASIWPDDMRKECASLGMHLI